ncbi:MAG TPA: peptidylprolyl isomerase [Lacunisphaera sp.]|nr:peptidylprolyl isomerase [Lacunisphaera sp.]
MRRRCLLAVLLLVVPVARLVAVEPDASLPDGLYAEFDTPHGALIVRLHDREVPLTVTSFVGLAEGTLAPRDGHPFYTGLTWYRVVPGFVIQSGNPGLKDTGDTPVPYSFPDEFVPGLRHAEIGTLSMANAGPDTNGCEFFLTLGDDTRLNYLYSVFGKTVRGREILPQIKADEPFTIHILRVGTEARAFRADADAFHALLAKARRYSGPAGPGPTAFFDDPAGLIPADPPRARYFNYKLANFAQATGVRIVGRLFPHSPPAAEDAVPGAYMHALATKLGVDRRGALVAYFADEKDWRVWLSDEAADIFLGHPATPADLAPEGPLHKLKTAFIDAAVAEGDAAYARQQKSSPPDQQPPPAQHLKLQVDALLDHLILKLEPKNK